MSQYIRGLTYNPTSLALVAGTTSTYTTTVASIHVINGVWGTPLTAQTNTASPTTDVNTGATFVAQTDNTACCYVWGVNAAGAIKVAQGPIVPTAVGVTTTAGSFIDAPPFPAIPDDFCPVCYTLVRTAPSAADFTFGSSSWSATGITTDFNNVNTLPERPQIT